MTIFETEFLISLLIQKITRMELILIINNILNILIIAYYKHFVI